MRNTPPGTRTISTLFFESTAAWTWLLNNWHKIRVALLTVKTWRCMIMNIHVNYFQRMVRNGFFIGKRILSAFPRYARLASHEQAVEKDSYALADRPELCRRVRSTDFASTDKRARLRSSFFARLASEIFLTSL